MANVVGMRNGDGWSSVEEIRQLFEALRLPPPSSLTRSLGQLRNDKSILTRPAEKNWALTPEGRERASHLIGDFDYDQIHAELIGTPGAEFSDERHSVIPPSFAPARWQQGITRLLDRYPFEMNVFCMTRFPEEGTSDPVGQTIELLREALAHHGLTLHLASDRQIEDDLFGNVGAYMWACQYGIGLFESYSANAQSLNSNMLIELGSMLIMGRRCAILKDRNSALPPTDLSGQIYKSVVFGLPDTVSNAVHLWLAEDLSLGRCIACPPVQSKLLARRG